METTNNYTYFSIESNGTIGDKGLIAEEMGVFDPKDITKMLNIKPFNSFKKGDTINKYRNYTFSSWNAEKSDLLKSDIEDQCMNTIKNLWSKVNILKKIKTIYDVNFTLVIVSEIYNSEKPAIKFNSKILEFCYLTGTEVVVDMYLN